MKMRTLLLSGIAGLAVASIVSFGAQAQTDQTAPTTEQAAMQTNEMNATGGQTPATAPSTERSTQHYHHIIYRGQSGPQDSTPAEKAATDRLNEQQLQKTDAATLSSLSTSQDQIALQNIPSVQPGTPQMNSPEEGIVPQ